jgi:proliferating cell nuclear antigen
MLEARLKEGEILRRVVDAIKDLVDKANFNCSSKAMSIQAMDSSNVSLIVLELRCEGFEHYRADRNVSLGVNIPALANMFKCMNSRDG